MVRPIDREAVDGRLQYIGNILFLADEEIPDPEDDEGIILFAGRHGQSLDWIFRGDLRSMVLMLAEGAKRAK